MTTSYEARNNSSFLMNNFPMVGEYGIAAIKKAEICSYARFTDRFFSAL
ncbi:hypothetical protein [Weissella cibaria]|nr:hypothetical protein [Weissella cibaria]